MINQNLPHILDEGWQCSRTGKTLQQLKDEGHIFIVTRDNTDLPFDDASIGIVITDSVPIDIETILGPGVQTSEINRIL